MYNTVYFIVDVQYAVYFIVDVQYAVYCIVLSTLRISSEYHFWNLVTEGRVTVPVKLLQ